MTGQPAAELHTLTAFHTEMGVLGTDDFAREWVHAVLDTLAADERWTPGQLQTLAEMLAFVRDEYRRRIGPQRMSNSGDVLAGLVVDVLERVNATGMVVLADLGLNTQLMAGLIARLNEKPVAVVSRRGKDIGRETGRKYTVVMREGIGE